MRSPIPDYLTEVLGTCTADVSGTVADYIPELAAADPDRFAVALVTADGTVYSAGDTEHAFSIQSISKPFVYGMALDRLGFDAVLEKIDVEPSGEAFNEISLEHDSGRPLNPMINAGALTAHALLSDDASPHARGEQVRALFSDLAGRDLAIDERVAASELTTTYRNIAIANLLRSYEVFFDDPEDVVAGYVRQCSVSVTVTDLAMMAGTLANGGVQPRTGARVFSRPTVRQVLSVMATCGMYDAAGDWLTTVGIPAKSGVSGGIIGILPGQLGIAVFSPRLDRHGNSARGVVAFERLSHDMNLHLMDAPMVAHSVLRRREILGEEPEAVTVLELQGDIQFTNAETVVRAVVDEPVTTRRVALDLTFVHSVLPVGRRMILEVLRRLLLDGHDVTLVDPDEHLPDPDVGDGRRPDVHRSVDDLLAASA
ncbi:MULTISPECIES: glutaminase [unclassified Rhodococcus (in: high G+C Gram-positive bacteria)]|uniref:glutaminase n=1 Tax=unclassified Rhodococcus (in: high G+C Gram-positive bacteria) TaxID=192944 RepID=UPI000927B8E2|nr:glutaminase [Rhodococcus sp. M8]OLL18381.1 glutaminase [Rhodococcus sp. M8]QPG45437.1 glutaminase [Rhodococcus sp. M8]